MIKKICALLFFVVFVGETGVSQHTMTEFLDSLTTITPSYFEKGTGFKLKSEQILQQIDTTTFSKKQVDLILEYYDYVANKKEDYPFPLLLWSKKASEQLNYQEGIFQSLIKLGDARRGTHTSNNGEYYREALQKYQLVNDREGIATMYARLGLHYMSIQDYETSLKELFKALAIYQEINNKPRITSIYHCIGDIYRGIEDFENSIKYLKLSIASEQDPPDYGIRAMNNGFLGEIYVKQNQLNIAKDYLITSNAVIRKEGVVPYLHIYNLKYLGEVEENNNNLDAAYNYYKKAFIEVYNQQDASKITTLVSTRMGNVLIRQQKTDDAIKLLQHVESEKLIKDTSVKEILLQRDLVEFYEKLGTAYELTSDYEKANHYNKLRLAAMTAVNKVDILKNTNELEKQYQSQIDQQEIQLLKDENSIKQRNLIITLLSLAGIGILLVFSYVYFKQRSRALKRKSKITELALEAEQIRSEKLKIDKQIEKRIAVEQLRTKISADLHDDVGSLLTGLAMQSEVLGKKAPENIRVKLDRISNLSRSAMLQMRDAVWVMDARKDNWQSLIDRVNEFASEHLGAKELA